MSKAAASAFASKGSGDGGDGGGGGVTFADPDQGSDDDDDGDGSGMGPMGRASRGYGRHHAAAAALVTQSDTSYDFRLATMPNLVKVSGASFAVA